MDEADDDSIAQPVTLDAPGVMVGKPDPAMLFPTGTSFMPYAVLHNVSASSVSATLNITTNSASGHPTTQSLDTFSFAPDQSVQVDMSRYFGAHNPLPDGYAQLSLSYNGRYRDLIFDTGSADQSGTYVFQVMPSGEAPTASKIISYWTTDGDSSTMFSVWNYASQPQDATLVLYYSGGQYRIPIHLEARQSFNLDMMTLLKSRMPDSDGNLIPTYIASGSAMLIGPGGELDKLTVVLSASGYNVRNATCFPMCINCGGVVSITVNSVSLGINQTAQATAEVDLADGSELEEGGDWTISNSAIASINGVGTVTGYVAGSAVITFTMLNVPPGTVICYQSDEDVCEDEDWSGEGGATVYDLTPVINSITSDTWNAGVANPNITISGQHFGTNKPTIKLSDSTIGISITSYSDTQIVATMTPPASTPNETVDVSVTNNGYGSNAFNGNGSGDSPTSSQQTATVKAETPSISLNRKALTTIQATGTPAGGAFSYSTAAITGNTNAKIAFASGASDTSNPNDTTLTDPANPNSNGSPSAGGLLSITASYQTSGGTATDTFQVPTFGLSCYYTALQSDWGTAPNNCSTLKYNGTLYSGSETNPNGLTGTFCTSFIIQASLIQGNAALNSGQLIQYNPDTQLFGVVSQVVGSDGSPVSAGKTLARDKTIIPGKGVLVDLDRIGTGILANDTGSAIVGYRFDMYEGTGQSVCSGYNNIESIASCSPAASGCPNKSLQ